MTAPVGYLGNFFELTPSHAADVPDGAIFADLDNGGIHSYKSPGGSTQVANAAPTPNGEYTAPNVIVPSVGITILGAPSETQWVTGRIGHGGEAVASSPQIAPGSFVGQELTLKGTSSTDFPILNDGNGVSLNGTMNLTNRSSITFSWDGMVWDEDSRR